MRHGKVCGVVGHHIRTKKSYLKEEMSPSLRLDMVVYGICFNAVIKFILKILFCQALQFYFFKKYANVNVCLNG